MKKSKNYWSMGIVFLSFSLAFAGICGENEEKKSPPAAADKKETKTQEHFAMPRRMGKMPGRFMPHPGIRGRGKGFFGRFTPEEREELRRLSVSGDREKFGKKLRELRKKYASNEDKKIYQLEEKYHAAKTGEEKAAIRKELYKAVLQQLKRRNEFTLKQIAIAEEKLARLKKFHASNEKNADKIAEKITERFCTPPAERKKFRRGPVHGRMNRNMPPPVSPQGRF